MATPTRTRFTALIAAAAITMTACGGGAEEVDSQAQIEELQAQIEDLQNTTTTAAPTTTTTVAVETEPVVEDTVAPVEETEPVVEETAPESAETEPVVEDTETEPVVAAPVAAGMAVPTGEVLNGSMGPAEAKDLFVELFGPTDDYTGQIARIAAFPALTTLPDTEITSIDLTLHPEEVKEINQGYSFTARFDTTAGAQDAVTAYTAEILAFYGGEVEQDTSEDDDYGTVYWSWIRGENYGDEYQVVAYEYQGLTTVSTKYSTLAGGIPAELSAAVQGIRSHLPLEGDPGLSRMSILTDSRSQVFGFSLYPELSAEETHALLDAAIAQVGWTPSEGFLADWDSPAHDGSIDAAVVEYEDNSAYINVEYAWR